jgi:DNA-binding NarL/FixJ family response regulator
VLIADPHDITLAGTAAVLERTPHIKVIGKATTAAAALATAGRHTIDLAILELGLDGGTGIEVCRRIRSHFPHTQAIILADAIDDESTCSALQAGATGIFIKSIAGPGLIRAVEAVCDGYTIFNRKILQLLIAQLGNPAVRTRDKPRPKLSEQEERVMTLVTEGKTNKEIAAVLGLSDKTVKNYLYHVYEKLQATRRAQATKMFLERTRVSHTPNFADVSAPLLPLTLPNQV